MQKIIYIVGPTAVGKTQLALDLAKKFDAEIISADSVQVYKGLDIISGKDLPQNYKLENGYYSCIGLPSIYLLDVVEPTDTFTVHDYYNLASKYVQYSHNQGKTPIIVGGTGLYVEALLNGIKKTSKPDLKLRKKLSNLSVSDLQKMLSPDELEKLNESDRMNPRRLVRRIETINEIKKKIAKSKKPKAEALVIGLSCEREDLKKRIDDRVDERLKNGALDEATKLFRNYENLNDQVKNANGYKQLFAYLKKETTLEEAIYRWKISEYRHAKNQMTWFRKYGNVEWYDIEKVNLKKEIVKRVDDFLKHSPIL